MLIDGNGIFKCPGCNTLRMDIPYHPRNLADAMEAKGMRHLPDCPLFDNAYPRNTVASFEEDVRSATWWFCHGILIGILVLFLLAVC